MEKRKEVTDLLERFGLNWDVAKVQLSSNPAFTDDFRVISTKSHGIFRKDTNSWLGTVSGRYHPAQNYQLAEGIMDGANIMGIDVNRGGLLDGGRKIYLQAELPQESIGNSNVKRHLTFLNSHDGSSSLSLGSSSTVVVCENTFFKAHTASDMERIRHSSNISDKLDEMVQKMFICINLDELVMDSFKKMATQKMNDTIYSSVIAKLLPTNNEGEYSKNRVGAAEKLLTDCIDEDVAIHGDTLWGLFNGITRYTTPCSA